MEPIFSAEELRKRNKIIKTQPRFRRFLNATIVDRLVHLFDKDRNVFTNEDYNISKYIKKERELQGLDNSNITIKSKVFGHMQRKSSLLLAVIKNGKDLIHLTIHLSPTFLTPNATGMIHIAKNVLKPNEMNKTLKPLAYALIAVHQPPGKPHSLKFTIADGYETTGIEGANKYDREIQQEMDVILTVLNRLFDEDDAEYYIGRNEGPPFLHTKTLPVLNNIDRIKVHSRKNRGTMPESPYVTGPPVAIRRPSKHARTLRRPTFKVPRRQTRYSGHRRRSLKGS